MGARAGWRGRVWRGKMAAGPAGQAAGTLQPPARRRAPCEAAGAILGRRPGAPERHKMAEGGEAARPGPVPLSRRRRVSPRRGSLRSALDEVEHTGWDGAVRPLLASIEAPKGG